MKTKLICVVTAGLLGLPVVASAENYAAYPYQPYPYYAGGNGGDFFDNGSFYSDSRGEGNGSASGEAEFSMSISGKGRGEQTRDGSFGTSGYGGNSNYGPYPYPYPAPYPYYGVQPVPASPSS